MDNLTYGGESLIDILDNPNFIFQKCDITIQDDLESILRMYEYYSVVHLGAIVGDPACSRHPELARKVNWKASKFLLERTMELGIQRFIFGSTCSSYGKMSDPDGYVNEDSPLAPVSLYAELKVRFEELFLHKIPKVANFCPTSLRFSTAYGLSHRMRFDLTVNEFTKELVLGNELSVYGEQFWRPYCHVNDLSMAILTVMEAPKEKVAYNAFNVGDTKENYTKKMIVEDSLKQFPGAKIKYVQKDEDPRDYRVTFETIKREVGFKISKTLPEGIKEIKNILESGIIQDPEERKYYNISY